MLGVQAAKSTPSMIRSSVARVVLLALEMRPGRHSDAATPRYFIGVAHSNLSLERSLPAKIQDLPRSGLRAGHVRPRCRERGPQTSGPVPHTSFMMVAALSGPVGIDNTSSNPNKFGKGCSPRDPGRYPWRSKLHFSGFEHVGPGRGMLRHPQSPLRAGDGGSSAVCRARPWKDLAGMMIPRSGMTQWGMGRVARLGCNRGGVVVALLPLLPSVRRLPDPWKRRDPCAKAAADRTPGSHYTRQWGSDREMRKEESQFIRRVTRIQRDVARIPVGRWMPQEADELLGQRSRRKTHPWDRTQLHRRGRPQAEQARSRGRRWPLRHRVCRGFARMVGPLPPAPRHPRGEDPGGGWRTLRRGSRPTAPALWGGGAVERHTSALPRGRLASLVFGIEWGDRARDHRGWKTPAHPSYCVSARGLSPRRPAWMPAVRCWRWRPPWRPPRLPTCF